MDERFAGAGVTPPDRDMTVRLRRREMLLREGDWISEPQAGGQVNETQHTSK